jgi:hypothetical protein
MISRHDEPTGANARRLRLALTIRAQSISQTMNSRSLKFERWGRAQGTLQQSPNLVDDGGSTGEIGR